MAIGLGIILLFETAFLTGQRWLPDRALEIILGVTTIICGIIIAWVLRRLSSILFVEYDRSVLVRVEIPADLQPGDFANWPIINGALPFRTFGGVTVPDVQTGDVVGFIVGEPTKFSDTETIGAKGWPPGYFAYAAIHWNKYQEVKALVYRGYYLQQTFLPDAENKPTHVPQTRFLRFAIGSNGEQGIANIVNGPLASFKYQPYKKHGFDSTDIEYRKMTPQARLISKIGNLCEKRR